jgi:uncharacterized glyoxalase superfamily protein PhnB
MANKKAAKAAKKPMKKPAKKAAKKSVAKRVTKPAAKTAPKKVAQKKVAQKSAPPKAAKRVTKKAPVARGFALQGVSPGFTANDAAATIAWYCDVLGFTRGERWEHEGQFLGGQVQSGAITINIGQDDWKLGRDRVKGQGTHTYISIGPDIDSYANQIKARGGVLAQEPKDDWGLRAFSINDPDGFKLTFMTTPAK